MANEIAGKLFGYLNDELTGMKMSRLFTMKDGFKQDALLEQHIDTEGNIVMVSGKVVSSTILCWLLIHFLNSRNCYM